MGDYTGTATRRLIAAATAALAFGAMSSWVWASVSSAGEGHDHGAHAGHQAAQEDESRKSDGHAGHAAKASRDLSSEEISVRFPEVDLVDRDGRSVRLDGLTDTKKTVVLNFVFTTCNAICPIMSSTFSGFQNLLGSERDDYRLISISIDPEYDTPEKLREYAERHSAAGDWRFLTGSRHDVVAVQRAFDAYRGSKMNHEPATYFWREGRPTWIKLNGLATPSQILTVFEKVASEGPVAVLH
ncbi:MAG: SCO family protein [bacterium]|nr:SCO family protein [bacterium]